ncbi:MAG: hypothetical protein Q8K92_08850 [Leadbetterella sp.]|nr:hypothetical protein [Leadbetterella sp.]
MIRESKMPQFENRFSVVSENKGGKSLDEISNEGNQGERENKENLENWWKDKEPTIVVKKPKYGADKIDDPKFYVENLRNLARNDAMKFIERVEAVKKFLPSIDSNFFTTKANQIANNVEGILKSEDSLLAIAELPDSFRDLTLKPGYLFFALESKFFENIENESAEYFKPLINAARSDVRRFLIKHFNTIGITAEQAQNIIGDKAAINAPIKFGFRINVFGAGNRTDREGVLGSTDMKSINIYIDDISFLENGKLDEGELFDTVVHELVHTVSDIKDGAIGLNGEKLFDANNSIEKNSPETNLNELVTEVVAMGISSKYFNKETFVKINRTDKQEITGYQDLVQGFNDLMAKYPKEGKQLLALATDAMLRGEFTKLQDFLVDNKDLFEELKKIVVSK